MLALSSPENRISQVLVEVLFPSLWSLGICSTSRDPIATLSWECGEKYGYNLNRNTLLI